MTRLYGRQHVRGLTKESLVFFEEYYPKFKVSLEGIPENLWLEIGFGYGEYLIARAQQHPERFFIGCEPFLNGMIAVLKSIMDLNISNIMLYRGDARHILEKLPPESLGGIYLLCPDPWPKNRHAKRRFVQQAEIERLHRLLKPQGIWHMTSDHPVYQKWIEDLFKDQDCFEKVEELYDGVVTKYQEWALQEGRMPVHYVWRKKRQKLR